MDGERKMMRSFGLIVALSTPVTGFIAFAIIAIVVGEDRLEDATGTTPLGYASIALPLAIGLTLAAYAHFGGPLPSRKQSAVGLGAFGLVYIAVGLGSVLTSESASIGGALVVMFGIALLVASAALVLVAGRTPPPPPAGP